MHPCEIEIKPLNGNRFEITVRIPDFVGLLTVITGSFASLGISIQRGVIETLEDKARDVFEVHCENPPDWERFRTTLRTWVERSLQEGFETVRPEIHRAIIHFLRQHKRASRERLSPIDLHIDQEMSPNQTLVQIHAQDTPAFLFELTNALSLMKINIVRMEINTIGPRVEDKLWLNQSGQKITSERTLKSLRWAVLMIKQFTHLLPNVPDPESALEQFGRFGRDVFEDPQFDSYLMSMRRPDTLETFSRVMGTSQFLWEEFIRIQYETVLPLIQNQALLAKKKTRQAMKKDLHLTLCETEDFESKVGKLNEWKDREMFRIDLRHILGRVSYLGEFAEEFTDLVEAVVETAAGLARDEVSKKMALPMVSETQPSESAVFGLGKFGGRELGYASDLELLFIYEDDKESASARSQDNLKFYSEMVRVFKKVIHARHEGVFEIDLRLRPYGKDGPLASSLTLFEKYYSAGGEAWSFERQALTKMRFIAGSAKVGKAAEALRDRFVYSSQPYDFKEFEELRQRQENELTQPGIWNAKYSAGGLLDIEYLVQVLQLAYGQTFEGDVRSPNTLKALRALWQISALEEEEFQSIRACYIFLRDLINALRIVRGNAKDLSVPQAQSEEFVMLGRRVGYGGQDDEIRSQFERDISHFKEIARQLFRKEINRLKKETWSGIPASAVVRPAVLRLSLDELLKGELSAQGHSILKSLGFQDTQAVSSRLKRLCPKTAAFEDFAKAIDLSWPIWPHVPSPDLALLNLESFFEALGDDKEHYWLKIVQTKSLQHALRLFGSSRYLPQLVTEQPDYWTWIGDAEAFHLEKVSQTIQDASGRSGIPLDQLRILRHRETLKIALADLILGTPLSHIYRTYTKLAEFIMDEVLKSTGMREDFCVLGMGKLGGGELNISSDLDLMFLTGEEPDDGTVMQTVQRFMKILREGTMTDFLYRLDLRLRPHGNHGSLFLSETDYKHYYQHEAEVWELQALIRTRPVAGNRPLGEQLLNKLKPLIFKAGWTENEKERLFEIKHRFESMTRSKGEWETNVKMGAGGIRDIEFAVQYIQLFRGGEDPELVVTHTLDALDVIERKKLLTGDACQTLRDGYLFFRRVENWLHFYENRQIFTLPEDPFQKKALARILGFQDSELVSAESLFEDAYRKHKQACRTVYQDVVELARKGRL